MMSSRSTRSRRGRNGDVVASAMRPRTGRRWTLAATSLDYRLLITFVTLVFLVGGSSRADSLPLVILHPVAALLCGYGFHTLRREQYHRYRILFWLLGATIALCLIHLCPLPPLVWRALPGRDIVAAVDGAVGLTGEWRPFAMVPYAARNALFSLLVPLATLLLGSRLDRSERERLLPLLIGIGAASGLLGVLQVLGGDASPFYFYSRENNGSAVGLFANRNHSAVLLACLFPMLATWASQSVANAERARFRIWVAVAGGLALVPVLVISGSRAAILVALPALASVPLLYRRTVMERRRKDAELAARRIRVAIIAVVGIAMALVLLVAQRTGIASRFMLIGGGDDLRFLVWGGIVEDIWRFFPWGSGVGSFVEVYQIHEPYRLLRSSYLNHAHNDLLEVVYTTGLPGLLLILVAFIGWATGASDAWRNDGKGNGGAFARMASVVLFMLFLASISDYPLRTPSLACFGTLATIWLAAGVGDRSREAADG